MSLPSFPQLPALPADPLVSVVVPCHNYGRFVGQALRSVVGQSMPRWECIVVDDGSTDDSVDVVASAATADQRITLLSKARGGAVSCLVDALPLVHGDIVCLLDADDEMLPRRLESVVAAFLAHDDAALVVHRLYLHDTEEGVLGLTPLARRLPHGDLRAATLLGRSGVTGVGVTSGLAVRADALRWLLERDLLPLPVVGHDTDEFIRRCIPLLGSVVAVEQPLGLRRLHDHNTSRAASDTLLAVVERYLVTHAEQERVQAGVIEALGLAAPSREDDLDLLAMAFVRARLRREGANVAARGLFGASAFAAWPITRRCFWRVARRLPVALFTRQVRLLYSPGGRKPLLNHVRLLQWGRRAVARDGLDATPTLAVLRRAIGRGW